MFTLLSLFKSPVLVLLEGEGAGGLPLTGEEDGAGVEVEGNGVVVEGEGFEGEGVGLGEELGDGLGDALSPIKTKSEKFFVLQLTVLAVVSTLQRDKTSHFTLSQRAIESVDSSIFCKSLLS